jgi:hypothetical protein
LAYSLVKSPRFYINVPEWLNAQGVFNFTYSNQQPLITLPVGSSPFVGGGDIDLTLKGMTDYSFIAMLGHDFGGSTFYQLAEADVDTVEHTEVINSTLGDNNKTVYPDYNGFSISTFSGWDGINRLFVYGDPASTIGSIVIGTYYQMNAPNLSLTLSHEFSSTKEFTTLNGSSISNTMWTKPMWGDLGAWELNNGTRSPHIGFVHIVFEIELPLRVVNSFVELNSWLNVSERFGAFIW